MDEKSEFQIQRELNIRRAVIIAIIAILIIAVIVTFSLYIAEENFRKWIDSNLLRKDISSENVETISLDVGKNNQIICYSKYIGILNDKNLKLYNQQGGNITDILVNINTAIYDTNDKYLAIAEENGQEFCVILDKTYLWKQNVEGEILQIHINKNGYVALVTKDTTYKSIITLYDSNGNQLLKSFQKSTRVIDVSISNDNKYIAVAEMDISGTLIQSNIKIISVEKAKTDANEAIEWSKQAPTSKMVTKIKYQEKNKLVCVYDNSINIVEGKDEKNIIQVNDDMTFISGNLSNSIAYIKEERTGVFNSNSSLNITNIANNQNYTYSFAEIAKEMYTYENIIGINIGTEIYFINTAGALVKKYSSDQEITNVIMSNEIALIIYKDKIEIINL